MGQTSELQGRLSESQEPAPDYKRWHQDRGHDRSGGLCPEDVNWMLWVHGDSGKTYKKPLAESRGDLVFQIVNLPARLDIGRSTLLLKVFSVAVEDSKRWIPWRLDCIATVLKCWFPGD